MKVALRLLLNVFAWSSRWCRAGYLAAFLAAMFFLGWAAMWVTFVVMLAIYGA